MKLAGLSASGAQVGPREPDPGMARLSSGPAWTVEATAGCGEGAKHRRFHTTRLSTTSLIRTCGIPDRHQAGTEPEAVPANLVPSSRADRSMTSPMIAEPIISHTEPVETLVQRRVGGRIRELRVVIRPDGVILKGHAASYHAKQVAQHAVMELAGLPILANDIEVD